MSFHEDSDLVQEEQSNISFWPEITIDVCDVEEVQNYMPVITCLAGYCFYIVLKKVKCDCCKVKLVLTDELLVEDKYTLITNLTRGGLLYPCLLYTSMLL